jgi:hypothetical protein
VVSVRTLHSDVPGLDGQRPGGWHSAIDEVARLRFALSDIASGDETSTVAGAVAIAKAALSGKYPE